ncbi:MAG: chemotaxis protein CheW, partial [Gemmatimonadetes bacterium]|nr:chemotaxis protein CheW [Gemmatimonadota bacterium]
RSVTAWLAEPPESSHAEEIFRALHTVKGMAASLGFDALAEQVHAAETVLAEVRGGERAADRRWLEGLEGRLDALALEVEAVLAREAGGEAAHPVARTAPVVRVDTERLDALLADLGAMVTARQELDRQVAADPFSPVARSAQTLSHRLDALKERILHVRLAPLGEVLERIPPMVRDLGRQLGKQLAVEISGEELEVDRAILAQLPEPLMHLVRNAVDHGLETPAERKQAGKRPVGRLTVRARQERDAVVVELADDGRGIDRERIAARAREQGILEAGATLSDEHLLGILARPGFSTAQEVSAVSGRGVGLDTVVARLHEVGAAVSLTTVVGHGSSFQLRLPTRLGIVRALVTAIGEERYVMPLTHVTELVAWDPAQVRQEGGRAMFELRGETIPVLDLRRLLQYRGGSAPAHRPAIVFAAHGQRIALLADAIAGQIDAVIQPIDRVPGLPRWITGATVLGDGRPAMLLDVASVA